MDKTCNVKLSDGMVAVVDRVFPVSDGQEFVHAPGGGVPQLFTCLEIRPSGFLTTEVVPVEEGGPFLSTECYPLIDLVEA